MDVWLIKAGEALPCDEPKDRLKRMGLLANELERQGHHITWFNSSFNHSRKVQRCEEDRIINISKQYKINLMWSNSYKNVSLARIKHHIHTSYKFKKIACSMKKPDIIVCSMPTIELAEVAIEYGKNNNVPVVIDIRDLWPDIFEEALSSFAGKLVRPYIWYSRRRLKKLLRQADAITGLTREYLEWGLNYANRKSSNYDRIFNMGYKSEIFEEANPSNGWKPQGINDDDFVICFFGHLGRQFDFKPVIESARLLNEKVNNIKFVICGNGESLSSLEKASEGLSNVIFPGWVNQKQIQSIMKLSSIGIAPYKKSINFTMNVPNKFGEYLSAGLPILLGIDGAMERLINDNSCGYQYKDANELEKLILKLQQNDGLRAEMSVNAKKLFESEFNADKVYCDMVNHLEAIVNNKVGNSYKTLNINRIE